MSKSIENKIAIVDYGLGNLFNVQFACQRVGLDSVITSDKKVIAATRGMILPGVGAFGDAMQNLNRLDLVGTIRDHIEAQKPFLGICLGLQLLLTSSEEFGDHQGLGIIKGRVVRFKNKDDQGRLSKVPQVGWNRINYARKTGLLDGVVQGEYMYFVHSYYVVPEDHDVILTTTTYEHTTYCSSVLKGSLWAMQFHPEKSGLAGLQIYKNWAQSIRHGQELMKQ